MTIKISRESIPLRDKTGKTLGKPMSGGCLYTGAELLDAVSRPRDWGPWRLDPETFVLYPVHPYRYEVDLESCLTPALVLDRIAQVSQKRWADAELVAGLVRALDDVLYLQGNLCPCGQPSQITPATARDLARAAARDRAEQFRVYPELAGEAA